MSWFSKKLLGLPSKIRVPKVEEPEEFEPEDDIGIDAYLKRLMKKSGFEKTIITGHKQPNYLGAR